MVNCTQCSVELDEIIDAPITHNEVDDSPYCDDCAEVVLFESEVDGNYYPREIRVRFEGRLMTEEQQETIENSRWTCGECRDTYDDTEEQMAVLNGTDNINVCRDCRDDHYVECYSCDDYNRESEMTRDESNRNRFYCDDTCRDEDLSRCHNCDEYHNSDEMYFSDSDDEYYCNDCRPSHRIRNYTYRPSIEFFKERADNELYFGVELEVDGDKSNADALTKFPDNKYVFKEDSSTEGFEIVSQPMTIKYIKQNEAWYEKLQELKSKQYTSYRGGNCGIHVHVSKDQIKPIDAWKMVYFMHKCQEYIHKFTQRTGSQRDRWANYKTPEYMNLPGSALVMKESYPSNSDRYVALNFTSQTIEFRIFRGTLDHTRFTATLEFVKVLTDYTTKAGINHFRLSNGFELWSNFYTFAQKYYGGSSCLVKVMKKYNLNRQLVY